MPTSGLADAPVNLADDLLRGAEAIAHFLYGDAKERRKVYHLAEHSRIPIFRLGAMLCARRTILLKWIAEQEQRGWCGEPQLPLESSESDHEVPL